MSDTPILKLYMVECIDTDLLPDVYDVYIKFVICAESAEEARNTHPNGYYGIGGGWNDEVDSWIRYSQRDKLAVDEIGTASANAKKRVVVTSFNNG